jgi:hypothetical protein
MNIFYACLFLLGLIMAACSPVSTSPSPDMTSGVFLQMGYAFYRWEDGLSLMIWHDGIQTFHCGTSGTTSNPQTTHVCRAHSRTDGAFEWQLETKDGKTTTFLIDGTSFDLKKGQVFFITSASGETKVLQLERFPSEVLPTTESVTGYGLGDAVIKEFIFNSSEIQFALRSLITFFEQLHAGEYDQAAALYGGTLDVLHDHNPEVDRDDQAELFRNACEINGAQCLEIDKVVFERKITPAIFKFFVQFKNADGSLFSLGQCCGEAVPSPQSQFVYLVKKVAGGDYRVLDLPIYAP